MRRKNLFLPGGARAVAGVRTANVFDRACRASRSKAAGFRRETGRLAFVNRTDPAVKDCCCRPMGPESSSWAPWAPSAYREHRWRSRISSQSRSPGKPWDREL